MLLFLHPVGDLMVLTVKDLSTTSYTVKGLLATKCMKLVNLESSPTPDQDSRHNFCNLRWNTSTHI